jgi:hypothetical protein
MSRPVVLFRAFDHEAEAQVAARHLPVIERLEDLRPGDLVIGRFSLVPFYEAVEAEVRSCGAELLVPHSDARYLANMEWVKDLGDLTPATWIGGDVSAIPADLPHGYFVKGVTHSRKHEWGRCFAASHDQLAGLIEDLRRDPLIGGQAIAVREFVPLHTYGTTETGLPIAEEYRLFVLDGRVLSSGFYWSSYAARFGISSDPTRLPSEFITKAISRIPLRYFVMDVAITADGSSIVIELNDPGLSGLSDNDPEVLYAALAEGLA